MSYKREYLSRKTLAKDLVNKQVSGVCSGIAKHYEVPRLLVRVAALFALFSMPVVTVVAYFVAAALMPTRY
ncbi:PspC domain-containing protein [Endozoicomonas sp. G2_1]|uniref:PspC domain-containing protein n=1 Tax=Endozoicomonas sp. G2_1 TaxID=2821091 RepID=UPI001ADA82DB|nr:PspC domain-containing protein [Endozoicomonas sp. G2_1]MBO9489725.1 PspC domain-containing protein [Endozoicomonas sp. G2_1]